MHRLDTGSIQTLARSGVSELARLWREGWNEYGLWRDGWTGSVCGDSEREREVD